MLDLLAFALDGERYALPAADVLEVQRAVAMAALRPVAGPGHSEGVAKLPDGLLVIHDPRTFLSLDEELQLDSSVAGAAS